jgi:hypothetical protein
MPNLVELDIAISQFGISKKLLEKSVQSSLTHYIMIVLFAKYQYKNIKKSDFKKEGKNNIKVQ